MAIEQIRTERLLLLPFTLRTATSLLDGDLSVLAELGLTQTMLWPDQEARETLPKIIRNLKLAGGAPTGFESWMVVLREEKTVIGDAGFKGQPGTGGAVDLGYAIIEQEQRKGYGLEVAQALTTWALGHPEVQCLTARCLLDNTGSSRILRKLGMYEVHRDEKMIYWRLSKQPAALGTDTAT
ncbi:GNAT family N-acetyltransferase [Pontibacter litorisediminis]|uniref:GNAT family N-acetyltransferase n=1 Tax=Pontibacter litorisediminis TaxID=1846260 RepID=UPI0023EB0135|nr:GNAT family N-acetyltransferase [Pontibacter litorisediminis]